MSTIRANNIQGLDAPNPAIELPIDGTVILASGFGGDLESKGSFTASGLTVDGTATFAVGASGTPAIAASGDANTGIYFPAADTIGFAEGGNEAARITSAGRVGIGTSSPGAPLEIQANSGGEALFLRNNSSEVGQLHFRSNAGSSTYFRISAESNNTELNAIGSSYLSFVTNSAERMRIKDDGDTAVYTSRTDGTCFQSNSAASADNTAIFFTGKYGATGTSTGTISFKVTSNGNVTNTNNSYGSLSDIKLKENIVDAGSQWDDLKAIQVRNYNFKEETGHQTHTQLGVIAQEIELVSPGLVTETPDRDDDNNDLGTTTKSVNYSVLYMKAVKALQEAMERIETLEAEVAALKGA